MKRCAQKCHLFSVSQLVMSLVRLVCAIKRAGSKGEPHILESLKWQDKNPGVQIGMEVEGERGWWRDEEG